MITNQTNRPGLRLLVVLAWHDAILPNLEGVHQTRDGSGETRISPEVTAVEPGLVTISDCVDKTGTDYLQNGTSIKAPNAAGSYFRHPAVVQVAEFTGGSWLVLSTADDWTKTC